MTTAHLPGTLTPAAIDFLEAVGREKNGRAWALTYAGAFIGGMRGSDLTHISQPDEDALQGAVTFRWSKPPETEQQWEARRYGRRK